MDASHWKARDTHYHSKALVKTPQHQNQTAGCDFFFKWTENERDGFPSESKREKACDRLDACIKRKESISFHFWTIGTISSPKCDALRIFQIDQGKVLQRSPSWLGGEDKSDPAKHNSRRATVKEKQTEHMAPLWSWLTLPHDTTGLMETSQLALKITCLSAPVPSTVAAARFWFSGGNCQKSWWSVKSLGFF